MKKIIIIHPTTVSRSNSMSFDILCDDIEGLEKSDPILIDEIKKVTEETECDYAKRYPHLQYIGSHTFGDDKTIQSNEYCMDFINNLILHGFKLVWIETINILPEI